MVHKRENWLIAVNELDNKILNERRLTNSQIHDVWGAIDKLNKKIEKK